MNPTPLAETFFRHEYSRLVAVLVRRLGSQNLELVEDAVQAALLEALNHWRHGPPPSNPSGWIYRVALNKAFDEVRTGSRRTRLLQRAADSGGLDRPDEAGVPNESQIEDDLLRMVFVACHPRIPRASQLVLALKTLCGFDVREIAFHLFANQALIYKRLQRARQILKSLPAENGVLMELTDRDCLARLPSVVQVLYALFSEGYLSHNAEGSIRRELCHEAIRLAQLLNHNPVTSTPETMALQALMHLHAARLSGRTDGAGGLLLLEEQDRRVWDHAEIQRGMQCLESSARGEVFTRYHAEAAIAAEHCLAASVEKTRWDKISEYYELLEYAGPSPVHRLNQAVALARWKSPADALVLLAQRPEPAWLTGSYLWLAVHAYLYQLVGDADQARDWYQAALRAAPNTAVRQLLTRRFLRTET